MAMHRKGCTKIERVFGEPTIEEKLNKRGIKWNKVGMQYGELIVEEDLGNGDYLCACSCGNYIIVNTTNLRNNIKKTKTHCGCLTISYIKNEEYFDIINTEEKAYILGFLMTDGCIGVSGTSKRIKITLKSDDINILEKIKKELNTDAPISIQTITTKLPQGTFCTSEVVEINICSNKLCNTLSQYGIIPNKTYNGSLIIDKIPKELRKHIVRGAIDGDGTFGIYCDNELSKITYHSLMLIGNENFLRVVSSIIAEDIGIEPRWNKSRNNITTIEISSKNNFQIVQDYLYKDAQIYLDRKYNKYFKCKQLYKEIQSIINNRNLKQLSNEERKLLISSIKTKGSNDYPERE